MDRARRKVPERVFADQCSVCGEYYRIFELVCKREEDYSTSAEGILFISYHGNETYWSRIIHTPTASELAAAILAGDVRRNIGECASCKSINDNRRYAEIVGYSDEY
jgi:hypothetical protein